VTEKILSIQLAAVSVLPTSILGGYTFPLLAMPEFFQKFAKILPFVHYAGPIRKLFIEDIGINYIMPEINWFIKFTIYMWVFSLMVFFIKKFIKKGYNYIKDKKNNKKNTEQVVEV
jgi:ABC-2 type transport system permease protein